MEKLIEIRDLAIGFGDNMIIDGLELDVYRGEVLGVVGGSGTGKSLLMRSIIGLIEKQRGTIHVFGQDTDNLKVTERIALDRRWGVLFQQGALFSSLTVKQNILMPLREFTQLPEDLLDDIARSKIDLVGLKPDAGGKYPAQLSGGMIKRAGLARALALDPELLFLDEPTAGLDPVGAAEFDSLIATLKATLGLTVFMVTHDLDTLATVCDRIAALAEKKVIATGTFDALTQDKHHWLQSYFGGVRAKGLQSRLNLV
jgi:phospholipid/cholesterol/gamma-HCH transport system ATP-binding protein